MNICLPHRFCLSDVTTFFVVDIEANTDMNARLGKFCEDINPLRYSIEVYRTFILKVIDSKCQTEAYKHGNQVYVRLVFLYRYYILYYIYYLTFTLFVVSLLTNPYKIFFFKL